jgi:hypothetical protein
MCEAPAENRSDDLPSRLWRGAKAIGVPALVSVFISTLVSIGFQVRLENSKNRVELIIHEREAFDNAQSTLFIELGRYTSQVLDSHNEKNIENLNAAIVTAQLQAHSLSNELNEPVSIILKQYSDELSVLQNKISDVKNSSDLGPVYSSAQELLKLHDNVAETVSKTVSVSIF